MNFAISPIYRIRSPEKIIIIRNAVKPKHLTELNVFVKDGEKKGTYYKFSPADKWGI